MLGECLASGNHADLLDKYTNHRLEDIGGAVANQLPNSSCECAIGPHLMFSRAAVQFKASL
jgi:hypothetical protein